jgi:hypothetical protein
MAHTFETDVGSEHLVWHVDRLWEAARELPVQQLPVAELERCLDEACWFAPDQPPTPRAVAQHAKRIYDADLSLPIILSAEGWLMDGVHRLAKAWVLGLTEIQAVRFTENPPPVERRPIGSTDREAVSG